MTAPTDSLASRLRREFGIIRQEPWLLALAVWLPPLLYALFWWIFSAGLAFDLPIGVVDLDHTQMSRTLVRQCDGSSVMAVERHYSSVDEGRRDLEGGGIYALLVVPPNLYRDTLLGRTPRVTVFYNGQFILIGKQINAAVQAVVGQFAAGVGGLQSLARGTVLPAVAGQVAPVRGQMTALFNIHSNYAEFLVSGGIPAIWQILVVMLTILALAAETRHGGLARWADGPPLVVLAGKLLPYTLLLWLQGVVFATGMYGWLGWPMHGSWPLLLLAQLLTVLAGQAMGCILFLLTLDAARALSLAAAYTAPGFAFMGVTFPATDMGTPALVWRALMPVTHYIRVQIQQANYGADCWRSWPSLLALLLFLPLFFLALRRVKRLAAPSTDGPEPRPTGQEAPA